MHDLTQRFSYNFPSATCLLVQLLVQHCLHSITYHASKAGDNYFQ